MLFSIITYLRNTENKSPPSVRWFTDFIKQNKAFKFLRTKFISRLRIESYNMQDIEKWHKNLRAIIKKHNI
jgi:hypothetical protein